MILCRWLVVFQNSKISLVGKGTLKYHFPIFWEINNSLHRKMGKREQYKKSPSCMFEGLLTRSIWESQFPQRRRNAVTFFILLSKLWEGWKKTLYPIFPPSAPLKKYQLNGAERWWTYSSVFLRWKTGVYNKEGSSPHISLRYMNASEEEEDKSGS